MDVISSEPKNNLYPYNWSKYTVVAVCKAIYIAWNNICENPDTTLNTSEEVELNSLLHEELYRIWEAGELDFFNKKQFYSPQNSGNYKSYDEKSLEKKPDIVIELVKKDSGLALSYYDKFFIECKIVDPKKQHQKINATKGYLSKNGIMRFITGEYAWASTQSAMIAYSRNQFSTHEFIKTNLNVDKFNYVNQATCQHSHSIISEHSRKFFYKNKKPGNIFVYHIDLLV